MHPPTNIDIIRAAEPIIRTACELNGEAPKKGGHMCVARPDNEVILVTRLGVVEDRARADRTLSFCQEKVRRLSANPNDVSSYQTRDPDNNKYGGGIRLEDGMLYAFSGLPELWDEAAMVTLAMTLAGLKAPSPHLAGILKTSRNPHAAALFAACLK
jgi:hypothetical protein